MNTALKQSLCEYRIIEDPFEYEDLPDELKIKYHYFEEKFQLLFKQKAEQYKLKECHFYIKNNVNCNAFARNRRGYNIISISHAYVIQMSRFFNNEYFSSMMDLANVSDETIRLGYTNLIELEGFDLGGFLLNSTIQFTFTHEFQHILQMNSSKIAKQFEFNENMESSEFDIKKHAWEFDADRFAAFDVIKHAFEINRENGNQNDTALKCMLFLALGGVFISKLLFYLGVVNTNEGNQSTNIMKFYTKKFSHPHPIVRLFNVMEYYHDSIETLFPELDITTQEILNNTLLITKIYTDSILPDQDIMKIIFSDLDNHLNEINAYNVELYNVAIKDSSIRELLIARGINFTTD